MQQKQATQYNDLSALEVVQKKKKREKIASIVSTSVLVFLLAIVGYLAIANMNGRVPSLFGYALVRIQTSSMEPTIPTGSYILIKKTDAEDIGVDDIITFYSDDPAIAGFANTHRVLEIVDDSGEVRFITKGDYNATSDLYPARGDKLIGIYIKNLPLLGSVVNALTNKIVFALLILVPSMALVTMSLRDIWEKAAAVRRESEQKQIEDEIERLKKSGELEAEIQKLASKKQKQDSPSIGINEKADDEA